MGVSVSMGLGVSFSVDVTGALVVAGAAVSGIASAVVPVVAVGVAVGVDVAADNGNGNGKDKDVIGVIGETTIVEILVSWDARKANASSPAELERGRPGLPEAPILIPLLLDALALALTLVPILV